MIPPEKKKFQTDFSGSDFTTRVLPAVARRLPGYGKLWSAGPDGCSPHLRLGLPGVGPRRRWGLDPGQDPGKPGQAGGSEWQSCGGTAGSTEHAGQFNAGNLIGGGELSVGTGTPAAAGMTHKTQLGPSSSEKRDETRSVVPEALREETRRNVPPRSGRTIPTCSPGTGPTSVRHTGGDVAEKVETHCPGHSDTAPGQQQDQQAWGEIAAGGERQVGADQATRPSLPMSPSFRVTIFNSDAADIASSDSGGSPRECSPRGDAEGPLRGVVVMGVATRAGTPKGGEVGSGVAGSTAGRVPPPQEPSLGGSSAGFGAFEVPAGNSAPAIIPRESAPRDIIVDASSAGVFDEEPYDSATAEKFPGVSSGKFREIISEKASSFETKTKTRRLVRDKSGSKARSVRKVAASTAARKAAKGTPDYLGHGGSCAPDPSSVAHRYYYEDERADPRKCRARSASRTRGSAGPDLGRPPTEPRRSSSVGQRREIQGLSTGAGQRRGDVGRQATGVQRLLAWRPALPGTSSSSSKTNGGREAKTAKTFENGGLGSRIVGAASGRDGSAQLPPVTAITTTVTTTKGGGGIVARTH